MARAPYYIIVTLKKQVMLSFLQVRVVVNNRDIYPLRSNEPVVIPVEQDNPLVVVTDGFHFTRPIKLTYKQPGYYNFYVGCSIEDHQLIIGSVVLGVCFMLGFVSGLTALKLLSFVPIVLLLFYYYINRANFIRIHRSR